jgi:AAA+ ATPase superfamily predicted ATPase
MILSGSSVSMMEKHALSYKSPLYGRRTGQWSLRKLEPKYLASFFPDYPFEDLLLVYSSLDMIPGYLVQFNRGLSVWENVQSRMLSKGEFLYEEVEILLREELRDPSNYMSILASIAGGLTTFSEIHSQTGLDKSMLSKYISVLEKLAIVGKSVPVTEGYKKKLKARGGLYSMRDNFFDFWFRFVYPNVSQLETGQTREVLSSIKRDINPFLGRKFEAFITESFPLFFPNLPVVGRWWHKGEEIDVVALNDKTKEILFCECKWQNNVDGSKVLKELKEKAEHVSWKVRGRVEHYCIFAKSFSRRPEDCSFFDLKDVEKIFR